MKYICSATVKHLADQPRDWLSFIASYSNTNVVVKMLMFLFSVVMVFGGASGVLGGQAGTPMPCTVMKL